MIIFYYYYDYSSYSHITASKLIQCTVAITKKGVVLFCSITDSEKKTHRTILYIKRHASFTSTPMRSTSKPVQELFASFNVRRRGRRLLHPRRDGETSGCELLPIASTQACDVSNSEHFSASFISHGFLNNAQAHIVGLPHHTVPWSAMDRGLQRCR